MSIIYKRWVISLIICILLCAGAYLILPDLSYRLVAVIGIFVLWAIANVEINVHLLKKDDKKQQNTNEIVKAEPKKQMIAKTLNIDYNVSKLPSYLIIGSSQSGKTTFVKNSGFNFPAHEYSPYETKNTNIWLSNKAVLYEANNIDELSSSKFKGNINGIILCFSVVELLEQGDNLSQKINLYRQHIDKIQQANKLTLPIYLVITKLDLLRGFDEYFKNSKIDREKTIFGFSAANHEPDNLVRNVTNWLSEINSSLGHGMLVKLNHMANINKLILSFPEKFNHMGTRLITIVQRLVEDNHFHKQLFVRGLFFTSNNNTASFIPELWQQIINENNIVQRPKSASLLADKRIKIIVIALTLLSTTAFSGLFYHGYRSSQFLLNKLNTQTKKLSYYQQDSSYLVPWLESLAKLQRIFINRPMSSSYLGLSVDNKLQHLVSQVYRDGSASYLNPLMKHILELSLQQSNGMKLYSNLMIYLMLGQPNRYNCQVIQNWLDSDNSSTYRELVKRYPGLEPVIKQYYSQKETPILLNESLITKVKSKLATLSVAQRAYLALQQQAQQAGNTYVITQDVYDAKRLLQIDQSQLEIPYLYTKMGITALYPKLSNKSIINSLKSDWVLGNMNGLNSEDIVQSQLQTLYLNDYVARWQKLLSQIKIMPFNNLTDAIAELHILSQQMSPIYQILMSLNDNTTINQTKVKGITVPLTDLQKQARNVFTDNFSNVNQIIREPGSIIGYRVIQADIIKLSNMFVSMSQDSDPAFTAFKIAQSRFANNQQDPISQLYILAQSEPQPVNEWLTQIADYSWQLVLDYSARYIHKQWQQTVASFYDQLIAGRYPVARSPKQTISLTDFNHFYASNGLINKFMHTNLAGFYGNNCNYLVANTLNGMQLHLPNSLLHVVNQSLQIQDRFFSGNQTQLQLSFSIMPINLDADSEKFTISINGKALNYAHGPEYATNFSWPSQSDIAQVKISFTDLNGVQVTQVFDGPWALWKWLRQQRVRLDDNNHSLIVYTTLGRHTATLLFHVDNLNNPFVT